MSKTHFIGCAMVLVLCAAGCSKQAEAPVKKTQARIKQGATNRASSRPFKPVIQSISDNPAYYSAREIKPQAAPVKDLDNAIRPVLVKLFGAAKIIEEKGQSTATDGEVILNQFTYVTKQLLTEQDIKDLHAALLASGFSTSPRLGSKPTTTRNFGMMSLFKSTNAGHYSLEIRAVFSKQTLTVTSYQLGSKYDRLM